MASRRAPILIIGAGGHGREIHDVVAASTAVHDRWQFLGYVDDASPEPGRLQRQGATYLGDRHVLNDYTGVNFVVGVGAPEVRRTLSDLAVVAGLHPAVVTHPSAVRGSDVTIGEGSVMCANSSVSTNIRIGRHVHLNRNVTVGHDSILEDFVTVHPGATLSGGITLGEKVTVGSNGTVLPGVSVGSGSIIGAGAVVLRDVPPRVTVVGVPARIVRRHGDSGCT